MNQLKKHRQCVIKWFDTIENKSQCFFIQLDMIEFYPSISGNILGITFNFAKQHTNTFDENLRILNIVVNHFCLITMNPGKRRTQLFRCDNGKL